MAYQVNTSIVKAPKLVEQFHKVDDYDPLNLPDEAYELSNGLLVAKDRGEILDVKRAPEANILLEKIIIDNGLPTKNLIHIRLPDKDTGRNILYKK